MICCTRIITAALDLSRRQRIYIVHHTILRTNRPSVDATLLYCCFVLPTAALPLHSALLVERENAGRLPQPPPSARMRMGGGVLIYFPPQPKIRSNCL